MHIDTAYIDTSELGLIALSFDLYSGLTEIGDLEYMQTHFPEGPSQGKIRLLFRNSNSRARRLAVVCSC